VFTGDPLRLPAGHFGLGHGGGAHAPDEYYVIESSNPKVQGIDGANGSYVEFLHELGVKVKRVAGELRIAIRRPGTGFVGSSGMDKCHRIAQSQT